MKVMDVGFQVEAFSAGYLSGADRYVDSSPSNTARVDIENTNHSLCCELNTVPGKILQSVSAVSEHSRKRFIVFIYCSTCREHSSTNFSITGLSLVKKFKRQS